MTIPSWRTRVAAAAFLLAACAGAQAADAPKGPKPSVTLLTPIGYADDATAKPAVREHCELETAVQTNVLEALSTDGREVQQVASKDSGEVLAVSIQRVQGLGAWAGPKTLSLMAHVYKDGKSVHLKMFSDRSNGVPLQGTCSILQGISKTLSKQLVKWLDEMDAAAAPQPAQ